MPIWSVELSLCCGVKKQSAFDTDRIVTTKCPQCRTLWVEHVNQKSSLDSAWQGPKLTQEFLDALSHRREVQAQQLLKIMTDTPEPILDYGCGQAVFFGKAKSVGHDIWAADIALPADSRALKSDNFVQILRPWEIPDGEWGTVVLLDVLEHHPDPGSFLASLTAQRVVVKVPLLDGPVGRVAIALARSGRPRRLESLLLIDEPNPHRVFFTSAGLKNIAAPLKFVTCNRIPDVGTELPERMMGRDLGIKAWPLRVVGGVMASIGRVWSDTAVFVFSRP